MAAFESISTPQERMHQGGEVHPTGNAQHRLSYRELDELHFGVPRDVPGGIDEPDNWLVEEPPIYTAGTVGDLATGQVESPEGDKRQIPDWLRTRPGENEEVESKLMENKDLVQSKFDDQFDQESKLPVNNKPFIKASAYGRTQEQLDEDREAMGLKETPEPEMEQRDLFKPYSLVKEAKQQMDRAMEMPEVRVTRPNTGIREGRAALDDQFAELERISREQEQHTAQRPARPEGSAVLPADESPSQKRARMDAQFAELEEASNGYRKPENRSLVGRVIRGILPKKPFEKDSWLDKPVKPLPKGQSEFVRGLIKVSQGEQFTSVLEPVTRERRRELERRVELGDLPALRRRSGLLMGNMEENRTGHPVVVHQNFRRPRGTFEGSRNNQAPAQNIEIEIEEAQVAQPRAQENQAETGSTVEQVHEQPAQIQKSPEDLRKTATLTPEEQRKVVANLRQRHNEENRRLRAMRTARSIEAANQSNQSRPLEISAQDNTVSELASDSVESAQERVKSAAEIAFEKVERERPLTSLEREQLDQASERLAHDPRIMELFGTDIIEAVEEDGRNVVKLNSKGRALAALVRGVTPEERQNLTNFVSDELYNDQMNNLSSQEIIDGTALFFNLANGRESQSQPEGNFALARQTKVIQPRTQERRQLTLQNTIDGGIAESIRPSVNLDLNGEQQRVPASARNAVEQLNRSRERFQLPVQDTIEAEASPIEDQKEVSPTIELVAAEAASTTAKQEDVLQVPREVHMRIQELSRKDGLRTDFPHLFNAEGKMNNLGRALVLSVENSKGVELTDDEIDTLESALNKGLELDQEARFANLQNFVDRVLAKEDKAPTRARQGNRVPEGENKQKVKKRSNVEEGFEPPSKKKKQRKRESNKYAEVPTV
jgi:hypothetical protein